MLGLPSAPASSPLRHWLTEDLLREEAGKRLFEQGQELLARQRVLSVREHGASVAGTVEAGRQGPYFVQLSASGEGNVFDCQCPDFWDQFFCKHVVAVGLAWLRQQGHAGDARGPADVAPSSDELRPSSPMALRDWVERHQVMHAALASIAVLSPYLPAFLQSHHVFRYLAQTSVFATLANDAAKAYLRSRDNDVLKEAAWAWLRAEADRVRRGLEQEATAPPRPPPTDERLTPLVEALLQERARVRGRAVPRVLEAPAEVSLLERPLRLLVSESSQAGEDPGMARAAAERVTLAPLALLEGRPGLSCSCSPQGDAPCVHALTALDAVLDMLSRRKSHGFNARLAELLFVIPGQELLGALEKASLAARVQEVPAPVLPVTFRLEGALTGGFSLRAYVHRPMKRGGFSKGTQLSWRDREQVRAVLTQPGELEALALIDASAALAPHGVGFTSARREGWPLLIHSLRALAHSPRLRLAERPDVPLCVREASLGFTFEEGEGGTLRVRPSVEGAALRPEDLCPPALESQATEPWLFVEPEVPRVTLVAVPPEARALLTSLREHGSRLPVSARGPLLASLGGLEARFPVTLPESLEATEVEPARGLLVRLRPVGEEGLAGAVLVRPLLEGPPQAPGEGAPVVRGQRGRQRVMARRAFEAERAEAAALLARLGLPEGAHRFTREDVASSLALLEALEPLTGPEVRVEWEEQPWKVSRWVDLSGLKVRVEKGRDWFGVKGGVEVDGARVELAVLLEAVRRGNRYARLGPGRWLRLTEELRERLASLADLAHPTRHGLEVGAAAAPALEALEAAGARVQAPPDWRRLATRVRQAQAMKVPVPRKLKAELRDYQREGFTWMARLAAWGAGACLADDMGLGKTLQALALLLHRAGEGPALVVAPTSVGFNWVREAARFAPSLRVHSYREAEREALLESLGPRDVLVASYGLLVRDAERFASVAFATFIVDEAQAVKNPDTARARAVRAVNAGARVALTGTPVENSLSELWSLYALLFPGLLGSRESFRERFSVPIERAKDAHARASLARVVRPFLLRRTKAQVARELPARIETVVPVALSEGERRLYDDVRLAALAQLGEAPGPEQRFAMLAALTRLRLAACHPRLVDGDSALPSSKLERLLELVDTVRAEGGKALVFSQFVKHLALVREALEARGVAMQYLDGQTPPAERQARVEAFQRGEGEMFLISLKAGGTGLNLTAADHVIHLDPWWNPAVEDQATDRAHRIGQTKPVTVSRLVSEGTLEEAILALHAEKRELADSLLSEADGAAALSPDQLLALLRFGGEGGVG
ncbi:DEAD/DEAH box helicase [Pyxidicoccus xibeiensis]|uniref:DEAD/DEAH box helicase n=1 Tax=Pyxidicoccus xibeiensis TaxID=2906759 RepID=UPI0020A81A60|nr:DEAD/DEAH box helicase [Pyxidicoccus xibeiensis]MCP3136051.1 DEAD/DEAH box helicase [Pyxidicoccus xibeiensis]